jgi:hypothetical protein
LVIDDDDDYTDNSCIRICTYGTLRFAHCVLRREVGAVDCWRRRTLAAPHKFVINRAR